MGRISKEAVQAFCEVAYNGLGEGDEMTSEQINLVRVAVQSTSDLLCEEVVNPVTAEKMPFLICSLRNLLNCLERDYPISAAMAAVMGTFIGSKSRAVKDDDVLAEAMRAMNGERGGEHAGGD